MDYKYLVYAVICLLIASNEGACLTKRAARDSSPLAE